MKIFLSIVLITSFSINLFSKPLLIKDNAFIITNQKIIKQYTKYNKQLLKDYDIDFRIITTNTEVDINNFSNHAFNDMFKENRSKSGKNLLMVIGIKQQKLRLEVSNALEPIYTDVFVSYLERKGVIPYFKANKIEDAIYAFTELIRDRAVEAKNNKEFIEPMETLSIGGGAINNLELDNSENYDKKGEYLSNTYNTPEESLDFYINEVLKKHNKNPDLEIYTDKTKEFWKKWVVTEINQDHEIHNIKKCNDTKVYTNNNYAVIRSIDLEKNRLCSPYFFKKEKNSWKLDFATMSKVILFNHEMQFHFDLEDRLKDEGKYYAFAFDGWKIGNNGFLFKPNPKYVTPKGYRWGFSAINWYKPGPSREEVKTHRNKYLKAMISYIYQGSYAEIRLGLQQKDYVEDVEVNGILHKDVLFDDFFKYIGEAKTGSLVKVYLYDYKHNFIVREGIAP